MKLKIFFISLFFCGNLWASQVELLDSDNFNKILEILEVSKKDISIYQDIFENLEKENWKKIDKLTPKIKNPILMGHVLSKKYLSNDYKTTAEELKNWIETYNDHIGYNKIATLANRKGLFIDNKSTMKIAKYKQIHTFKKALKQGKTKQARNIIESKEFIKNVGKDEYNPLMTELAFNYFLDNMDDLAFKYGAKVADKSNDVTAHWIAGISSYRAKKYSNAAKYFDKLSKLQDGDEWVVASGGYWAYLSYNKLNKTEAANQALRRSATYARTFYGILANQKLGSNKKYIWQNVSYINDYQNPAYLQDLLQNPAISRALILLKIGQTNLATAELQNGLKNMTDSQKEAVMFIANQYKIYHLAILIANQIKDNQKEYYYDDIAYPNPKLKPNKGWKIDKALLLAVTRQESAFLQSAQSGAGAKGLMQLMPNTAYHITKDRRYKINQDELFDMGLNLDLGQRYVAYLLEKPYIKGNLFFMMTAYNAGPGNFLKWQKKQQYYDTPLLFIETIPARETRVYIKRVMANYWIYSQKLNKENKTLDMVAQGKWPIAN